jgi:hypothetical protein
MTAMLIGEGIRPELILWLIDREMARFENSVTKLFFDN